MVCTVIASGCSVTAGTPLPTGDEHVVIASCHPGNYIVVLPASLPARRSRISVSNRGLETAVLRTHDNTKTILPQRGCLAVDYMYIAAGGGLDLAYDHGRQIWYVVATSGRPVLRLTGDNELHVHETGALILADTTAGPVYVSLPPPAAGLEYTVVADNTPEHDITVSDHAGRRLYVFIGRTSLLAAAQARTTGVRPPQAARGTRADFLGLSAGWGVTLHRGLTG